MILPAIAMAGPISLQNRMRDPVESAAVILCSSECIGAVYTDALPLPTRLMAGLAILKHTYDLSDEVLCERWVENPITSSSAARSCSSTGWCSIARR